MGRTNVLFAGGDVRRQIVHQAVGEEFPYRVMKRRNKGADGRPWCPVWRNMVRRAAKGFGFEFRLVKGAACFRTKEERDLVTQRADMLWRNHLARHAANTSSPSH